MSVIFWCILLLFFVNSFNCSDILIISPHFDRAHYLFSNKLAEQLHKNGHIVTFLSPHAKYSHKPEIGFYSYQIYGALNTDDVDSVVRNYHDSINYETDVSLDAKRGEQISKFVLYDRVVQDLMSNNYFDLVIIDYDHNDAVLGLGLHFRAPVICVSINGNTHLANTLTGNPTPTSYIPHSYGFFSDNMNFFERLPNVYYYLYEWYYEYKKHHPLQEYIYTDVFKKSDKKYNQIFQNIPLVLVNSEILITRPRPNLPNMINVGGYHINKAKPVPTKVEEFINNSARRIIFFSFGDAFQTINMTEPYRKRWYSLLSQLQQNIVFRGAAPNHTYPKNIFFDPTISHVDILCHNNVKLFITSGELSSTYESLYCGKPVIGIIFDEMKDRQHILKISEDGWGTDIHYDNFIQSGHQIIETVINNQVYINIARRTRKTYFQLLNAEYLTLYWINYVINHGLDNFDFMISPGRDMSHVIYYSIDIYLCALLIFVVFFYLLKLCCKCILKDNQRQIIQPPIIIEEANVRHVRFHVEEVNRNFVRRRRPDHRNRGRTI